MILLAIVSLLAQINHVQAQNQNVAFQYFPHIDSMTKPMVFVVVEECNTYTCEHQYGTDVLYGTKPRTRNALWVLIPRGAGQTPITKYIFPLPEHAHQNSVRPGYKQIDLPADRGSVIEPNLTLDGKDVVLTYFHSVDRGDYHVGSGGKLLYPKYGADLYKINIDLVIRTLRVNPNANLANLNYVKRLTYQPERSVTARFRNAANPREAQRLRDYYGLGVFHGHGIEVNRVTGRGICFVTDEQATLNTNPNGNEVWAKNTMIACGDYAADGTLTNINREHYYTTTAVASLVNLRKGFGFSYQDNTFDPRSWVLQLISDQKWKPGMGYGSQSGSALHFIAPIATVPGDPSQDVAATIEYYHLNGNGYGAVWGWPLNVSGTNNLFWRQVGNTRAHLPAGARQISIDDGGTDDHAMRPCPQGSDRHGLRIGRFTTPTGGVRPKEAYLAATFTCANSRNGQCSDIGQPTLYDSVIVYKRDITARGRSCSRQDFVDVLATVRNDYGLIYPRIVASMAERMLDTPAASSIPESRSFSQTGEPIALTGTGSLINTDIAIAECSLTNPTYAYNPHHLAQKAFWGRTNYIDQKDYQLFRGSAKLAWRRPGPIQEICLNPVRHQDVLGMQINLTSTGIEGAYLKVGGKETLANLGVTPRHSDTSISALVPSNVPVDFWLIDALYGKKIADLRGWHSFRPGESRTDCGGCHQHGWHARPVDYETSDAARANTPTDLISSTPIVRYDRNCRPQIEVVDRATVKYPVWGEGDLHIQFNNYCGTGCHNPGQPGSNALLVGHDAASTYTNIRPFLHRQEEHPAVGSELFWAARGHRTDGRDNSLYSTTYKHSPHPDRCAQGDQAYADFVDQLGDWIDSGAKITADYVTGFSFPGPFADRFPPTVSVADADVTGCFASILLNSVNIGYWDDSGQIDRVEVKHVDGSLQVFHHQNGVAGGLHNRSLSNPGGGMLSNVPLRGMPAADEEIEVRAVDHFGNQQVYTFTPRQLHLGCLTGSDLRGQTSSGSLQVSLSANPSPIRAGQTLTLEVNAGLVGANTPFVVLVSDRRLNSSRQFALPDGRSLPVLLAPGSVFDASVAHMSGRTDSNGRGRIVLPISPGFNQLGTYYMQGAVVGTHTLGISALQSIDILGR